MTPKAHAFILVVLFSSPDFVHSARFHLPFQLVELESALRIRITARFLQSLSFPRDPRLRPATEHRWGTEPPRRSRGPITGVKAPRTVPTAFPQRPGRALWGPRPCARYSGFRTRLGGAGQCHGGMLDGPSRPPLAGAGDQIRGCIEAASTGPPNESASAALSCDD